MFKQQLCNWVLLAAMGIVVSGCSDAKTTLIEKDPLVTDSDEHDHNHDPGHEELGRLVVLSATTPEAMVYDLADNRLLNAFALTTAPSAVYASGGYRYAVLVDRPGDSLSFLDGGVWQEDHELHAHEYEETPVLLSHTLSGSRPTHLVRHEQQLAVFFDGDSASSSPASVTVLTDADIANQSAAPVSLALDTDMHGAAEPRGEYLLSSIRRSDEQTTSGNPALPDQVGVFHLHDGYFEQEQLLEVFCPNLHGAAQNESYVAFGCSDGVLLAHEQAGEFHAQKVANAEDMAESLRIGTILGHEHVEQFIGLASAHGGASVQWFSIDPLAGEMEQIDWQPVEGAVVVDRGFSFEGEHFLILDDHGYLTILEPHDHDGHIHWEYGTRLNIAEQDVTDMPEGMNFSMAIAQNGNSIYIADPMAQHVLLVDLDVMQVIGDIELDFAPASLTWLGIAEDHEH